MPAVNPVNVPADIAVALKDAAKATGTGFDFLMQTAMRESGLNAAANASTSSAVGLFQFIEGTWMETLKTAGPEHGLNEIAAAIEKMPSGRYNVSDPNTKAAILALRTDPGAAALMAGELAQSNGAKLQDRLGRTPTSGELYIAHFLGAGGAGQLISAAATTPDETAATLFPRAAKANVGIFYNRGGKARTVGQVYQNLVSRHHGGERGASPVVTAASKSVNQAKPNQHAQERATGTSGPRDITPDLAKAGMPGRVFSIADAGDTARQSDGQYSVAEASTDRPLYDLFRPVNNSPHNGMLKTKPNSALAMQSDASQAPSDRGRGQALLATLKAYGMAIESAPQTGRLGPLDISPSRWGRNAQGSLNNSAANGQKASQAINEPAGKLWDGGLFTTGKTSALASSGGLFASPRGSH